MSDQLIFKTDIPGVHPLMSLTLTCVPSGLVLSVRALSTLAQPLTLDEEGCERLAAFAASARYALQRLREAKEL